MSNAISKRGKSFNEGWDGDITVEGGRTIIVEELSTTWCVSCAEIDPYLQQVADAHGSRITIVTYHPTDGDDAFQPEAAKDRIDRMKLINPQIGQTPVSWLRVVCYELAQTHGQTFRRTS